MKKELLQDLQQFLPLFLVCGNASIIVSRQGILSYALQKQDLRQTSSRSCLQSRYRIGGDIKMQR